MTENTAFEPTAADWAEIMEIMQVMDDVITEETINDMYEKWLADNG